MFDIFRNRTFLILAGVTAVVGLIIARGKGSRSDGAVSDDGTVTPVFANSKLYIPTESYHIEVVEGNQTISNSDNRQSATDGGAITNPLPVATLPTDSGGGITYRIVYASVGGAKKYNAKSKTSGSTTTYPQGTAISVVYEGLMWYKGQSGGYFHEDEVQANPPKANTNTGSNANTGSNTYVKPIQRNISYTVKKGDTLTSIAKTYKTTVSKIAKDNGIQNVNKIYAGQKLSIKN